MTNTESVLRITTYIMGYTYAINSGSYEGR